MDMMAPPKNWPSAPAKPGVAYSVPDPVFKQDKLAVMLLDTWVDFGTKYEEQRRMIEQQNKTLLQLKAMNDVLVAQMAALQEKHDNLREATRKERTDKILGNKPVPPTPPPMKVI